MRKRPRGIETEVEHRRVLARVLAEDLRSIGGGAFGPTPTVTTQPKDITNGTSDNDGPDPDYI